MEVKEERQEPLLQKVRELKQIIESQLKNNEKILEIKSLGTINWKEEQNQEKVMTQKEVFMVLIQSLDRNENTIQIEKYYTEDLECIAVDVKGDQFEELALDEDYLEYPYLLKELKKVKEKGNEIGLENLEKKKKENEVKTQGQQEKPSQEMKGLNIQERMDLNFYIQGETLENILGLKQKGITDGITLARVTTSSLNPNVEEKYTSTDAFVVIRANGEIIPLGEDILKRDDQLGRTPTQGNLTANMEGNVNQETPITSYKIMNKPDAYLQTTYEEGAAGGVREIKYTMRSNEKGQRVSIELPTTSTRVKEDAQMTGLRNDRNPGNRQAKDMINRANKHKNCDDIQIEDIDQDPNNDRHTHIEPMNPNGVILEKGEEVSFEELAIRWGFYDNGKPDAPYAKEKVEQEMSKNLDRSMDDVIEGLDEEFSDPRQNRERE